MLGEGAETDDENRSVELRRADEARRNGTARVEDGGPRARVLAVDDSAIFLRVANSVVSATTELALSATASSGEEAIRLLPDLQPDLALVDIHMPGLDGFETARIIARESPQTVVVLVSAEPEGLEAAAESAGAVALLDKVGLCPGTLEDLWLKHRPHD